MSVCIKLAALLYSGDKERKPMSSSGLKILTIYERAVR
jgi:hypothetical protein